MYDDRVRLRARATTVLDRLRVFEGLLWLAARRRSARRLPVLAYHSIHSIGPDYLFDVGVVDASEESFDQQMACVARYFAPITVRELLAAPNVDRLPPNPIAITFDDGYRNNLDVAVPILERHGLRATFFVATAFITERRMFWWDRISYVVKSSARRRLELSYPRPMALDLDAGRQAAIKVLLKLVKETDHLDIDHFLEHLTTAAGLAWDRAIETAIADRLLLTWDDVRALRARGMDVQSHTSTHRVLNRLSSAEAGRELLESRLTLERELGEPVRAVSYPCGYSIAAERGLRAEVEKAGYELGFESEGRMSTFADKRLRPLQLRRLGSDYDMSMAWFRGMLVMPWLAT